MTRSLRRPVREGERARLSRRGRNAALAHDRAAYTCGPTRHAAAALVIRAWDSIVDGAVAVVVQAVVTHLLSRCDGARVLAALVAVEVPITRVAAAEHARCCDAGDGRVEHLSAAIVAARAAVLQVFAQVGLVVDDSIAITVC